MRFGSLLLLCCLAATTASGQTVTDGRVWLGANVQVRPSPDARWRLAVDTMPRTRDGPDVRVEAGYQHQFIRGGASFNRSNHILTTILGLAF